MTNLKFARLERRLSQATLARMAGLSQPWVGLIETGRANPTPAELQALATALNVVDPSFLLKEYPDPFKPAVQTPVEQVVAP